MKYEEPKNFLRETTYLRPSRESADSSTLTKENSVVDSTDSCLGQEVVR